MSGLAETGRLIMLRLLVDGIQSTTMTDIVRVMMPKTAHGLDKMARAQGDALVTAADLTVREWTAGSPGRRDGVRA